MSRTLDFLSFTLATKSLQVISELWIVSSISMTAWLAPPCRGPHKAQIPALTEANRLAWLEPTSRTVEVEQFCS